MMVRKTSWKFTSKAWVGEILVIAIERKEWR